MVKRLQKGRIMHAAVEHGGVLYLGGIIADDTSVGMGDQTRQICHKLDTLLAKVGSDKTKLLSAQIFVTDMGLKDEMNEAWLAWIPPEDLPARATIGIASLGKPEVLLEIVVTAAVG